MGLHLRDRANMSRFGDQNHLELKFRPNIAQKGETKSNNAEAVLLILSEEAGVKVIHGKSGSLSHSN